MSSLHKIGPGLLGGTTASASTRKVVDIFWTGNIGKDLRGRQVG